MSRMKDHLTLEKSTKAKTHSRKVRKSENSEEEIVDPQLVNNELRTIYSLLYTGNSVRAEQECLAYLKEINTPKLSSDDQIKCEGKLTVEECWEALNASNNNNGLGNDE